MAYSADILADSINESGERLTTFEVTMPRIVLAEFNTHRMFSRNSASSRAIPVERQLGRVLDDPFVPVEWGINQKGMQATATLPEEEVAQAKANWLLSRDYAVLGAVALIGGPAELKDEALKKRIEQLADSLDYKGVSMKTPIHKQIANRLLEPFMWHTVIVTATDWSNYFALRANKMAQPEIQRAAYMMLALYGSTEDQTNHIVKAAAQHRDQLLENTLNQSSPVLLHRDEWHLPFIQEDEKGLPIEDRKRISVGRCAAVSFLNHDTKLRDAARDMERHDMLRSSGHMSPFEHQARPMTPSERRRGIYSGNFRGWHQYRKDVPFENDYSLISHDDDN